MNVQNAIKEYQAALETEVMLAQQETAVKEQRIAARKRLTLAKAELADIEHEARSTRPLELLQV